jgi:hypothetical protein
MRYLLQSLDEPGVYLENWIFCLPVMMRQVLIAIHFRQSVGHLELFTEAIVLIDSFRIILGIELLMKLASGSLISLE